MMEGIAARATRTELAEITQQRAILKGLILGFLAVIATHIALFALASTKFSLVDIMVFHKIYPFSMLALGSLAAGLMAQRYISYFYWVPRLSFAITASISVFTGIFFGPLSSTFVPAILAGFVFWFVANYFALKFLMSHPNSGEENSALVQPMAAVQMTFIIAFMIAASGLLGLQSVIRATELGAILMIIAACYGINGRVPQERRKRFIFNMLILPVVVISFAGSSILGELAK